MKNNKQPHGQGTFIYPNGNLYVGSFESGKRSGSGKLIYNNNGGVYEGYWASNRPGLSPLLFIYYYYYYYYYYYFY